MSLLDKFRQENPAYQDIPDNKLAPALYNKFYKDKISSQEFAEKIVGDGYEKKPVSEYEFSPLGAAIVGTAQGLSMGLPDEMAGAVGGGISALKGQGFKQGYEDVMQQQQEALQAARQQQGGAMLGGEIAGALGTGLAGGVKLAGTKLLQGAGLPTATGIGALSGGAYDFATGYGGAGERFEGVPTAAALGGLGGLAGGLIGRGIGRGVDKFKSLTSRAPKEVMESSIDDITGLSGRPLSETQDVAILAQQGDSVTMPKGAQTGDVNLMRLEEAARQGQFGDDLQRQINTLDDRAKGDVLSRIQSMVGKTTDESDELLSKGIEKVKGRYKAGKAMQNKLMKARNDAIAKTTVYKDYTKNTLGKQLQELRKSPDFDVALMASENAPIKEQFGILNNILKEKSDTGVNMKFLNAWRAGLNNFRGKGQQGVLAKEMSGIYDDWLDNVALSDAIKAGDEDIANKIFNANREYTKFKSLYGTNKFSGQNKAIENVLTQEEITPVQAVNTLFGKNLTGNNYTAQNLRRLIKGVEGTSKEGMVKNNFRSGLLMRAYEDSMKTGQLKLGQLKNNLIKLKNSEAYKMNLAEPEYDMILDNLTKDLTKIVDAQSRRDVYSPSGGAVMRGIAGLLDKGGYVLPSMRGAAAGVEAFGKTASQRPAKKTVEKSLQKILNEAQDVMSKNRAVYGSLSGGATTPSFIMRDAQGNEYYTEEQNKWQQ